MENALPFMVYAFVSSITPGPNNIMLTASGANFGFRRTIPHLLGVSLGFGFMIAIMGLGLGAVFHTVPVLQWLLKGLGVIYTTVLAWKIATAVGINSDHSIGARPLTFLEACMFQWVNIKAWIMAISAISIYVPGGSGHWSALAFVVCVFPAINLPSVAVWAGLGVGIRHWLESPKALRIFNITMAALLLLSMIPMVL